jgi:hypothetical protein
LVLRNKLWFENAKSKIEAVWTIIEKERDTGHEHRLPKKQTRKPRSNTTIVETNSIIPPNTCFINTSSLQNQIIYIDTKCELIEDISGCIM